jgi:hypothetical protein
MKRKALAKSHSPSGNMELPDILKKHRDIIDWLDAL